MKYLDYQGLQEYDALIKQYIQDNIPDSSQAAEVATALKNAYNTNATIKVAVCTQAEYNALQNPESNVLYIISDETSEVVNVEANPTLAGTESVLGSIKIGGIKYKMPSVVANETLSGNETTMTSLTINGTKYAVPQGTTITANPTLAGTETNLESIGIGGVNYAIPSGGGSSGGGSATLYEHNITIQFGYTSNYGGAAGNVTLKITTNSNTLFSKNSLMEFIDNNGFNNANNVYSASGLVLKNPSGTSSYSSTNHFLAVSGIYSNYHSTYTITFTGVKMELNNNSFDVNPTGQYAEISTSSITLFVDSVTQIQVGSGGGSSSGGTSVEANPTLDGTETTLTGLGIDGTNYAMPHLYEHIVRIYRSGTVNFSFYIRFIRPYGATITKNLLGSDNLLFGKTISVSGYFSYRTDKGYLTKMNVYSGGGNMELSYIKETFSFANDTITKTYTESSISNEASSYSISDTVTQIF